MAEVSFHGPMDFFAKIGVIVFVMAVLYLLSRTFAGAEPIETPVPLPPEPSDPGEDNATKAPYDPVAEERLVQPRAVAGTEIENYGFRTIDLRAGPPDPEDFFDELFVAFYSADTGHRWEVSYTVCTPKGMARFMREKSYDSLLANGYLIVERYNVDLILKTILEPADLPDKPEQPERDPDQLDEPIRR